MKHLFVMDPLAGLNLQLDSSLRLMFALSQLGHEAYACEPRQLSWDSRQPSAQAKAQKVVFSEEATRFAAQPPEQVLLADMAAIHMRKDPPYDMDYITSTWLLDSARGRAKLYNDPIALRGLNEKLAIYHFPEACRPALLSADPEEIIGFIKATCDGDGILKPLTLFGGRGVERLNIEEKGEAEMHRYLTELTQGGTSERLVQPFDKAIFEGEVRVFTAFGEDLAWCLKKPAPGEFLANTRVGATLSAYAPSALEKERVAYVAKELNQQGVPFVGFDLIGGWVSEINITSPRLLVGPGDGADHYGRMAELVEGDL